MERLRELADHRNRAVYQAAWKNPSLPEDVWHETLVKGEPEAWANPMAPIYLLTWIPRKDDTNTLAYAAYLAQFRSLREPSRCSAEGKALLSIKVQEAWVASELAEEMMIFLGWWVGHKGKDSSEHRKVVHILVSCVRTVPNLTNKDDRALDILQDWSMGGKDQRKKAKALADSQVVKRALKFAQNTSCGPWHAMYDVLDSLNRTTTVNRVNHSRMLADLIRIEMPLPPVE